MSDHVSDQIGTLVRRLGQFLNRKTSEIVLLLFNHKNAGSFGTLAGFVIVVTFTWKFSRAQPGRPQNWSKRNVAQPAAGGEGNGVGPSSQDCSLESNSRDLDVIESPVELTLGQIVRRKLSGGRKMTCQLLGVILEERSPEELQKQSTVRSSVLEVILEISKTCDTYLMERVLDDESELIIRIRKHMKSFVQKGRQRLMSLKREQTITLHNSLFRGMTLTLRQRMQQQLPWHLSWGEIKA